MTQRFSADNSVVRRLKSRYQGRCGSIVRTTVYTLILGAIVAFLVRLGPQPWYLAAQYWTVVIGVTVTIGVSIAVQAQSFRAVVPVNRFDLPYLTAIRVWSVAALTSIIAPFLIGVATRSALLVKSGHNLSICISTTLRQTWMGLELALLFGTITMPFTRVPQAYLATFLLGMFWLVMICCRSLISSGRLSAFRLHSRLANRIISPISEPIRLCTYPWFALQIFLMSTTYYITFNGMGAALSIAETTALASFSVIINFLFFIPNGLGVTDSLWVFVGTNSSLSLHESVAIALIIRLSHFFAAFVVACATVTYSKKAVAASK